ncbi:MAG: RagB/SusD family nutrient uptake outer membrane protein [Gemmatimonadetes bacterium]|nr:RagB/SusD family nutrient uptake outer membrane protein [Gemmatimonadota bacterium]
MNRWRKFLGARRGPLFGGLTLLWLGAGACSFDVTNPGPVQDAFLNDPKAFPAIVNGMGRDLADAMNYVAFHSSMVTRELFPTGGTGQFGISPLNADGILDPFEQGTPWSQSQRARWTAEHGVERLKTAMAAAEFAASATAAQGYLWAGYANRTLGENMCEAVIDIGAAQPRSVYLTRAEEQLTNAITAATAANSSSLATAARAGRAAVRVQLGKWSEAVTDAAAVPSTFVYLLPYHDIGDQSQYNRIAWAGSNAPYKTHTVWGTSWELYYKDSNDPRVRWVNTGLSGDGGIECCGKVPFYRQMKHADRGADIRLSTGAEMRLIEAEAKLRNKDSQGAIQLINALRATAKVAPVTAASLDEAWSLLKRERGIELWLEGRRLGDFRRWKDEGAPGALHPREVVSAASYLKRQDLCFPISQDERETNPSFRD